MGRQLRAGETFAGFRVHHRLGAGGMGDVYAVDHPRLPRRVALKLLNADATDLGASARFDREAETIARLDHPGIVGVLDRGSEHGQPWISMQLINGADAAAAIKLNGPMPTERVVRIGIEVAQALDAAHRRGVVHRDVKPANIMLTRPEQGQPERALITDFGISRLQNAPTVSDPTGSVRFPSPEITGVIDSIRATAAYASPEQLNEEQVDGRSDQYSLACTLYCLLTGHGPFPGTAFQAIKGHLTGPVPTIAAEMPQLRGSVSEGIERAMSKNPNDRFATCTEMMQAVAADLASIRPSRSRRRGALLLTAAGVALVVAAGSGIWWMTSSDRSAIGVGPPPTTQTTNPSTNSIAKEDALWQQGRSALALWPTLFPQSPSGRGYQGMLCTPNDDKPSHRAVQDRYRFVCLARKEGFNQPTVTVDLVAYAPGDAARAVQASVKSVPPLPVLRHGAKLLSYHMVDPVDGDWILVKYTAEDKKDYLLQVGSQKGDMSYSKLIDWISAAPF